MITNTGNAINGFVDVFTSYRLGQIYGMISVVVIFVFLFMFIFILVYTIVDKVNK